MVAEELYELFLKRIDEVSKVIAANQGLSEPMNMDAVITQLLRMARNAGWKEPEPKLVKYCSNRTCENFVSKSDRKKARAAIKQKAKGNK